MKINIPVENQIDKEFKHIVHRKDKYSNGLLKIFLNILNCTDN